MNRSSSVLVRGTWPGAVVLSAGWARAHARPFNDDMPEAALRLDRGSAKFLARCTEWLFDQGVPAVLTGPLAPSQTSVWKTAGFRSDRELALLERVVTDVPEPVVPTRAGRADEWSLAAEIDRAAFSREWRLGRIGLQDAAAATPRSRFGIATHEGEVAAFAVVGLSQSVAYLQRLAVHPDVSGRGLGRSLVRDSLRWARRRGGRTMLLNTQTDNHGAIGLYLAEGFRLLPERLTMLRSQAHP